MKDVGASRRGVTVPLLQFCTLYLVFQLSLMAFLKHDLKL